MDRIERPPKQPQAFWLAIWHGISFQLSAFSFQLKKFFKKLNTDS
jgi:hypothetical protein